jgi:hypothetical protein
VNLNFGEADGLLANLDRVAWFDVVCLGHFLFLSLTLYNYGNTFPHDAQLFRPNNFHIIHHVFQARMDPPTNIRHFQNKQYRHRPLTFLIHHAPSQNGNSSLA